MDGHWRFIVTIQLEIFTSHLDGDERSFEPFYVITDAENVADHKCFRIHRLKTKQNISDFKIAETRVLCAHEPRQSPHRHHVALWDTQGAAQGRLYDFSGRKGNF